MNEEQYQQKIKDLEQRIHRAREKALEITRLSRHLVGLDDSAEKIVTVAKMGRECAELLSELSITPASIRECIKVLHENQTKSQNDFLKGLGANN